MRDPRGAAAGDPLAHWALAGLAVLPFLPAWLRGLTPFWGDLTYLHHPWRAYDAQVLAAGRLPAWNPFVYFGMPQAAAMQDGLFYPGTVPFFLFGFPRALALFHALHYAAAGLLTYWWLRSLRLERGAALTGAVLLELGGVMLSRMIFLNHLAVLSLTPCLLLFFNKPWALALALALAFVAGYPTFLIGAAAAAWVLAVVLSPRRGRAAWLVRSGAGWAAAGLLAMALSAVLLLPAAELFARSRRATGVELGEALTYGFSPADLLRWVSPLLEGWRRFNPAVEWWKCCYLGFSGCLAAGLGWRDLAGRRRWALAAAAGAFLLALLGDSNPASRSLWAHVPALRFIRYPGNLAYLALPAASLLAAVGARGRSAWALILAAELGAYALWPFPKAPAALFASGGPLVRALQAQAGEGRYLLSPQALYEHAGLGVADWKFRLYGLTNAPFRLRSAANFGEPLVPRASYDFMDALHSAAGAREAAVLLPWVGVRFLMAPKVLALPGALTPLGRRLWEVHRVEGPGALCRLFPGDGAPIPEGLPRAAPPSSARPLASSWTREDAFEVRGPPGPAGWVFVGEPLYPGWRVWLETPFGAGATRSFPAALAFQKVAVPAGPWTLRFRYDPVRGRLGALLSAAALLAVAGYWYNRLLRSCHAP